ncbi:MAG: hypothetical protein ACJ8J0_22185 [Longimicrobiaceae bacterium]
MRSSPLPTLPPILALVALAACAPAATRGPALQDAVYARTPGDTLRYTWETEFYDPPQWDSVSARRSWRLAVTFTGGDTARAWIEALRLETTGSDARVFTAGPEVVGLPFVLRVGPLGSDSVLAVPQIPNGWSEARSQFNGFFPRLPGGPLRPGRDWSEGSTVDVSDSLWTGESTRSVHYQVVGDSTLHGARVVVIAFDLQATRQIRRRPGGTQLPPDLPYRPELVQTVSYEQHGRLYFEPRTGRLVRRTHAGKETQELPSYTSPEAAVLERRYRSTVELVPRRRR